MKDLIDGIFYWLFWYEDKVWKGEDICNFIMVIAAFFFYATTGINITFETFFSLELYSYESMGYIWIPLLLTLITAIYLCYKKRYLRIFANHDKFRNGTQLYKWVTIIVVALVFLSIFGTFTYKAIAS